MAKYWVVNTLIVASGKYFPGTGLDLTSDEVSSLSASGAFLWPQGDDLVDAAAVAASDARKYRGANEATMESIMLAAVHRTSFLSSRVFSNATRPDASTVLEGSAIWNEDDDAPNYSDGTDWRDSDGNIT